MGRIGRDTHLVLSSRELPNILAPQPPPIGQVRKDGILIDAGFLLQKQFEASQPAKRYEIRGEFAVRSCYELPFDIPQGRIDLKSGNWLVRTLMG